MKQLIVLLLLLQAPISLAFTLNNSAAAAFESDEVRIHMANNCIHNGSLSHDEILELIQEAMDRYWNTVSTSHLTLLKGNIVSASAAFHSDCICDSCVNNPCQPNTDLTVSSGILVVCNNNATNFPSTALLGLTLPNNISGKTIRGSLLMINDNALNPFFTGSGMEHVGKLAFLAHEVGHAIGLGHSPVSDSLMYYQTVPYRDRLGWDDIDGISYLYPMEQPINCGSIASNPDKGGGHLLTLLLSLGLIIFCLTFAKKIKKSLT